MPKHVYRLWESAVDANFYALKFAVDDLGVHMDNLVGIKQTAYDPNQSTEENLATLDYSEDVGDMPLQVSAGQGRFVPLADDRRRVPRPEEPPQPS